MTKMDKTELKLELNKTIDNVATKIDEVKEKRNQVEGTMQDKYNKVLTSLESTKHDLVDKYKTIESDTEQKLDSVSASIQEANSHFKKGVDELVSAI